MESVKTTFWISNTCTHRKECKNTCIKLQVVCGMLRQSRLLVEVSRESYCFLNILGIWMLQNGCLTKVHVKICVLKLFSGETYFNH